MIRITRFENDHKCTKGARVKVSLSNDSEIQVQEQPNERPVSEPSTADAVLETRSGLGAELKPLRMHEDGVRCMSKCQLTRTRGIREIKCRLTRTRGIRNIKGKGECYPEQLE